MQRCQVQCDMRRTSTIPTRRAYHLFSGRPTGRPPRKSRNGSAIAPMARGLVSLTIDRFVKVLEPARF